MALVGGACEGIAARDQLCQMCGCANDKIVSCTVSPAALGFCEEHGSKSADTTCGHKDHASMGHGAGQRILNLHGNSQQIADCLT